MVSQSNGGVSGLRSATTLRLFGRPFLPLSGADQSEVRRRSRVSFALWTMFFRPRAMALHPLSSSIRLCSVSSGRASTVTGRSKPGLSTTPVTFAFGERCLPRMLPRLRRVFRKPIADNVWAETRYLVAEFDSASLGSFATVQRFLLSTHGTDFTARILSGR